jgi:hypothetical protein
LVLMSPNRKLLKKKWVLEEKKWYGQIYSLETQSQTKKIDVRTKKLFTRDPNDKKAIHMIRKVKRHAK